jgi:hypothetical protein
MHAHFAHPSKGNPMQSLTSSSVLRRTRAGQAVLLGNEGLSPAQAHLLMRLNGYTALSDLVCEEEHADMQLAAMQLVQAGLACLCEPEGEYVPTASQWGELLSADAAGG